MISYQQCVGRMYRGPFAAEMAALDRHPVGTRVDYLNKVKLVTRVVHFSRACAWSLVFWSGLVPEVQPELHCEYVDDAGVIRTHIFKGEFAPLLNGS